MIRNRLLKTAVCMSASIAMVLTAMPAGAAESVTRPYSAVSFISGEDAGWTAASGSAEQPDASGILSGNAAQADEGTVSSGTDTSGDSAVTDTVSSGSTAVNLQGDLLNAADASLTAGYYSVSSKLGSSLVLDVSGASSSDSANVDISLMNGGAEQVFYVAPLGNGLYSLKNMNSGKMLDAAGAGTADGTNIAQYTDNGSSAQKWYISQDSSGWCTITASYCSKVLDVSGGSSQPGANVQLYASNQTAAQKWKFTKEKKTLDSGVYTISSALSSAKVLDAAGAGTHNGTNIQIWDGNGTLAQKFIVTYLGGGWYSIRNLLSRKALDVTGGSTANGANVQLYGYNATDAQKWQISEEDDGTFSVVSALGKALDVSGGSTANGANVQIYESNGSAAQRWSFSSADASAPTGIIVTIASALNDTKTLDVEEGGWDDGTNVQLYSGTDSSLKTDQQYRIFSVDGEWCRIMNIATGKVLTAAGNVSSDGTNVETAAYTGSYGQMWRFISSGAGDGSLTVENRLGRVLDVAGASTDNRTNIQIYSGNGTAAQRFLIFASDFNGNGWYSTDSTDRSYYSDGKYLTGWQKLSNYWYYLDGSGMMVTSSTVGTNRLQASGRMSTLTTVFENVEPGRRTVKNLLQHAMTAVGRTLYIWGGGWDSSDSQKIGYLQSWEDFFLLHGNSSYNRHDYENSYGDGLDCSGFMAWVIYNTIYTQNGQMNLLEENGNYYNSTLLATRLSALKWAYLGKSSTTSAFHPGDVVSMSGHVWMVVGLCSDGSVVLVHSSPAGSANGGGVQISGTVNDAGNPDSEAFRLAKKYMDKYFFEWPFGTASVGTSYTKNYVNFANWNTLSGMISDPDGYTGMTAEQVLKDLFGE